MQTRQNQSARCDILARLNDVFAGRGRAGDFNFGLIDFLREFQHDDGIGAGGQHAASVDEQRLAPADIALRRLAHFQLAAKPQKGGQRLPRAEGIGCSHSVAVDRALAEGGRRFRRMHIGGERAVEGGGGRYRLRRRLRLPIFRQQR